MYLVVDGIIENKKLKFNIIVNYVLSKNLELTENKFYYLSKIIWQKSINYIEREAINLEYNPI